MSFFQSGETKLRQRSQGIKRYTNKNNLKEIKMTTSKKNFEKEYPRVHSMLEELKKQNKELIWDKLSLAKKNEELKKTTNKLSTKLEFTYRKFLDVQKENVQLLKEKNLSDEKQLHDFYNQVEDKEWNELETIIESVSDVETGTKTELEEHYSDCDDHSCSCGKYK